MRNKSHVRDTADKDAEVKVLVKDILKMLREDIDYLNETVTQLNLVLRLFLDDGKSPST